MKSIILNAIFTVIIGLFFFSSDLALAGDSVSEPYEPFSCLVLVSSEDLEEAPYLTFLLERLGYEIDAKSERFLTANEAATEGAQFLLDIDLGPIGRVALPFAKGIRLTKPLPQLFLGQEVTFSFYEVTQNEDVNGLTLIQRSRRYSFVPDLLEGVDSLRNPEAIHRNIENNNEQILRHMISDLFSCKNWLLSSRSERIILK